MIEIIKHTGKMEKYTAEITAEDGRVTTGEREREILEVVQSAETTEENKAQRMQAARQRAAMLTRDTDYRHSVREK